MGNLVIVVPGPTAPCVVYMAKQKMLSVIATTFCNREVNLGDGVYQVPRNSPLCANCETRLKQIDDQLEVTVKAKK